MDSAVYRANLPAGFAEPYDEASQAEERTHLLRYWRIFAKHKWGILGLTFVVSLATALVAYSLRPVYQATATLLVEAQPAKFVSIDAVYNAGAAAYRNYEYYETQRQILTSRTLAEDVVNRLQLWKHPEFDPTQEPPSRAPLKLDWSEWLAWLPWRPREGGAPPDEAAVKRATVAAFMGGVNVTSSKSEEVFQVSFQSHDPDLAVQVANTLTTAYIEAGLEARLQMVQKASSWLTERLEGLREKLEESERALQAYRDSEDLIGAEGELDLSSKQLAEISERLVQARTRTSELQALYNQVRQRGAQIGGSSTSHPSALQNPLVKELKAEESKAERKVSELSKRYGPKHPKMIAAVADLELVRNELRLEIGGFVEGIGKELQIARTNEARLQREFNSLKDSVQDVNRKGFKLQALEREVEANRQLYDMFLTRFKETNVSGNMDTTNARVIDPAVSSSVVRPKKQRMMLVAVLLALIVGFGLAILIEQLDNTLKSGDEVEQRLGLAMLGTLPLIRGLKKTKGQSAGRRFVEDNKSVFAEAIRTIRTGVVLSNLDNPHKVVMITSTVPGEGKTTLAMNLALALAQLEKVLIVDADMRRASIASQFGIAKDAPGLSNLVAGTSDASQCVHSFDDLGLDVLPAGIIPPNPLELLSSQRFSDALEQLAETYDRVVIDTAPTQSVSDALMVSTKASAVLYVVKADSTPHPLAQAGVKRLRQVDAHLVGAVLNQLDTKKWSRYYARYGYSYDRYHQYDYYGGRS